MPDLMSAALFERDGRALVVHRRRAPLAGQWLLPLTIVRGDEAAEDALRRHLVEQFGIGLGQSSFVETVYITDPQDDARYVANIFRTSVTEPMRFNADGEYDDARWLGVADIEQLWMPPDLRDPLIKILNEPEAHAETDWATAYNSEGTPIAERKAAAAEPDEPAPDNRAGWDAISAAYQETIFGDRFEGRFMWSWTQSEDDLHLLDDVAGKRVLVLGCGGGQDVVALDKLGAVAVGIDASAKQIAYARQYAIRHGAANASFVEGTVEDLSRFDDDSFDMAVSAHMLNYVERIQNTLAETHRVLKPGGGFALSVRHPFDVTLSDGSPFCVEHAYWDGQHDWTWSFESGEEARFRQWYWTVADWFEMLTAAGFTIERLLEPREDAIDDEGSARGRRKLVPYSLYIKARKR
jgi:SAM-dependent methyltransferase/8-oxo-dGTP pyrophosphatase MutT (NUDIX family)